MKNLCFIATHLCLQKKSGSLAKPFLKKHKEKIPPAPYSSFITLHTPSCMVQPSTCWTKASSVFSFEKQPFIAWLGYQQLTMQ